MHRTKTFEGPTPGIVGRLVERINAHFARIHTRQSLVALDDHMLGDIGVSRGQIDDVIKSVRRS